MENAVEDTRGSAFLRNGAIYLRFALACAVAAGGGGAFAASRVRGAAERPAESRKFSARSWLEKRAALHDEAMRLRGAFEECAAAVKAPAENVIVPIENYPDGSVKASVSARRAQFFLETGYVWGEGVEVCQFSESGEIVAKVAAQNCVVDRKAKSGWAQGLAEITYGGTRVKGAGVYFSLEEEYVMITDGTEIVSTDLKLGGLKL